MMTKKHILIVLVATLIGLPLEAKKIVLMVGDQKISEIDTEDESTHCIYGMPFDGRDANLLEIKFKTDPITACYIGQRIWIDMLKLHGVRKQWLEDGLDPAKRPLQTIRIFERNKRTPDSYQFVKAIYFIPNNPRAAKERADFIGADPIFPEHPYEPEMGVTPAWYQEEQHANAVLKVIDTLRRYFVPPLVSSAVWNHIIQSLSATHGHILDLSGMNLNPDQFVQIIHSLPLDVRKEIEYLDVRNNQLNKLPAEIAQFENVTELWANNNKFSELPRKIIYLKNLKKLVIDHAVVIPTPIILPGVTVVRVAESGLSTGDVHAHDKPAEPDFVREYMRWWKPGDSYPSIDYIRALEALHRADVAAPSAQPSSELERSRR